MGNEPHAHQLHTIPAYPPLAEAPGSHEKTIRLHRLLAPCVGLALAATLHATPVKIAPGADVQAALNRGDDVLLQPAGLYLIKETLRFTKAGQSLRTDGTGGIATYATLRAAPGALATLIDAGGVAEITVENVILDGNRDAMVTADGKVAEQPFTLWGKAGGDRQTLRQCVILNARCGGGWAAVHVLDGCEGFTAENNILFGIGVDVRLRIRRQRHRGVHRPGKCFQRHLLGHRRRPTGQALG
jgi:hypothetical protein